MVEGADHVIVCCEPICHISFPFGEITVMEGWVDGVTIFIGPSVKSDMIWPLMLVFKNPKYDPTGNVKGTAAISLPSLESRPSVRS